MTTGVRDAVYAADRVGPGLTRDDAWEMYYDAFTEINRLAVQRHRMRHDEFIEVMSDARITKYIATRDGNLVGLATLTRDLEAWPLISPEYFAYRWPDHYRARRVFYVGFVCAAPVAPVTVFPDLITAMYRPVIEADGLAVMDFCAVNAIERRMPAVTTALLRRLNPDTVGGRIDTQAFHAWRFDGRPLWTGINPVGDV